MQILFVFDNFVWYVFDLKRFNPSLPVGSKQRKQPESRPGCYLGMPIACQGCEEERYKVVQER